MLSVSAAAIEQQRKALAQYPKLIPVDKPAEFLGRMNGIVEVHGDIESPVEPPEAWEVLR